MVPRLCLDISIHQEITLPQLTDLQLALSSVGIYSNKERNYRAQNRQTQSKTEERKRLG